MTAGTGRYDGYGFTIDSSSRAEYLARLSEIETIPAPTAAQTELARRYAYGLFIARPLELQSTLFRYRQDESATLELALNLPKDGQIRDMPDIMRLSKWLEGNQEDLLGARLSNDDGGQIGAISA